MFVVVIIIMILLSLSFTVIFSITINTKNMTHIYPQIECNIINNKYKNDFEEYKRIAH